jgi:SAM-dependent methyltransferase
MLIHGPAYHPFGRSDGGSPGKMSWMPTDLVAALADLRPVLTDVDSLVRAVASGRRRGTRPAHMRAELRPVDLRSGRHLQIVTTDGCSPLTRNHRPEDASAAVDSLLAEPFGNWHVETRDEVVQLRVTKKGHAQVHRGRPTRRGERSTAHDRPRRRLIDPDDPLFAALGADGDKRRQVEAFLRALEPALPRLRARARDRGQLRVVDLGCGNAYLTFAAHRWLTDRLPTGSGQGDHDREGSLGVRTVGVDLRRDAADRNTRMARRLGLDGTDFVADRIIDHDPGPVDLVMSLHACDTATDEALAVAVRSEAAVVLAAPCCHHDVQRQLAERTEVHIPEPYRALTRYGILRERFADVLTDTLRAELLRRLGYRVDVLEFVASRHTPRNTVIRAYRTGTPVTAERAVAYDTLTTEWGLTPALARLLADDIEQVR